MSRHPPAGGARKPAAGIFLCVLMAGCSPEAPVSAPTVADAGSAAPTGSAATPSRGKATDAATPADYQALETALRNRVPQPVAAGPKLTREELRQQAMRNPRDGRAWALLAYAEFEAEAYAESAAAFEKAVAVSAKIAADPGVLCDWADAAGMAQGGALKGRPRELISRALAQRPNHPKALEMAGSAAYEQREYSMAAEYWRQLLPQIAPRSEQHRALQAAIARAEKLSASPGAAR